MSESVHSLPLPPANIDKATRDYLIQLRKHIFVGEEITFDDADTTPSVAGANGQCQVFRDKNTGGTTVTNFDDPVDGQVIIVRTWAGNVAITDGGNFNLSANWAPGAADTIMLYYNSENDKWIEISRSAN
jgi:hypothetical protein